MNVLKNWHVFTNNSGKPKRSTIPTSISGRTCCCKLSVDRKHLQANYTNSWGYTNCRCRCSLNLTAFIAIVVEDQREWMWGMLYVHISSKFPEDPPSVREKGWEKEWENKSTTYVLLSNTMASRFFASSKMLQPATPVRWRTGVWVQTAICNENLLHLIYSDFGQSPQQLIGTQFRTSLHTLTIVFIEDNTREKD